MRKQIKIFLFMILCQSLIAQTSTISGYINDKENGESLIGATLYIQELKIGTQTNVYGFYSLSIEPGEYTIKISYIGYQTLTQKVSVSATQTLDFEISPERQLLDEVIVKAEAEDANVKTIEMSVNKVEMQTIKKLPAFLGEVDVIKSIQYLPGVSSVGEGASGFNVRGGGIDQNLILLDEAPVFNSSHLFGFFSVFNPDVVKDVKLIKGGIPSNYGGRVSSILDVRMKEGNNKKQEFSGGIGTIFSRFSYQRPFLDGKGSFIVALRRSYIDALAKPFLNEELKSTVFYFYDFTAKGNLKINDKNNIYLSGYFGRDVFGSDFGFNWGNATTTFRWNHVFNEKLFLNTTLFYSNYDYSLDSDLSNSNKQDSFEWRSNIINYSIKPDFFYYLNPNNTLSFGGQFIYYNFNPGQATAVSGGEKIDINLKNKFATESAFYISNEQKINSKLSLQYGLRYSFYNLLGETLKLSLDQHNSPPGDRRIILNTQTIPKGQSAQKYNVFEPRFGLNLGVSENSSVKLSYNRLSQFIHLMSNTTASSPLDVWTPSTNVIKPQISDQIALGFFKNLNNNAFETSVEIYYKKLQNQIEYVRGADLLLNPLFEADLLFGDGRAYGAEFYIKKSKGSFNGWLSYTLARTERNIAGLNRDEWFPARIDKTHNVALVAIYDRNKRWTFSSTFNLSSGTPASFPTNKFGQQDYVIQHNYYNYRNNYRIPASHRLDLAATRQNKHALFKKGESEWVFSIYNVYNRRNPFSVYVRTKEMSTFETEAVKYSVFASVLPSVTYNFKF